MKTLILVALVLVMASCSGGSSGGNGGAPGGGGGPENWHKSEPLERFTFETDLTGKESTLYTAGCKKPGKPDHAVKFDVPRLKVGMHLWNSAKISSSLSPSGPTITSILETEDIIGEVTNGTLIFRSNILAGEDFGLVTGSTTKTTCGLDGQLNEQCKSDPQAQQPQAVVCVAIPLPFAQKAASDTPALQGGTYTFRDGRKVAASLLIEKSSGTLICNGQTMGKGEMISRTIRSNDIPAQDAHYCGGATIFSDNQTFQDGKLISQFGGELSAFF